MRGGGLSVDIVYLWVDGSDPEIIKKRNYWKEKYGKEINTQALDPCRFIDNNELKYSLRSLEKYAPWINNIFIVTDNQIPKWLNTNHKKIHIVDHTEIMPEDALPTFNASAIETCIHKIPNLSEYFLFANDDMFFTKLTQPDFFYKNNKPIFRARHKLKLPSEHLYTNMLVNAYTLIEKQFKQKFYYDPHHSIDAYLKSDIIKCNELFKEELLKTTYSKFRESDNISRVIYSAYSCCIGHGELKLIRKIDDKLPIIKKLLKILKQDYHKDSIYFHTCNHNYKEKIIKYKPELICINDNEDTTDDDRIRMQKFLDEYFPKKSSYEI